MNLVTLIRHGQAGSRDDYDRLSETGRRQAVKLGAWLAREGTRFDAAVTGGLRRQRETAEIVLAELARAGLAPPQVLEDPRWNEFDIDAVFNALAPLLAAKDEAFRAGLETILAGMGDGANGIHRRWTPVDTQVVEAWIRGEQETGVESWSEFTGRVAEAMDALPRLPNVAVFTSATPAAISIARCFGCKEPRRIMHLAGSALNTNLTMLARRDDGLDLLSFNQVEHLDEKSLRTYR
ncbi:MAG: histidine phosphatase family protein [Bryobacteraceae bacterium]|nr:histidine phosphatase family protein [Bryobacteraceae bacterium]